MKHSLIKIISIFILFFISQSLVAMDSFDFVAAHDKRIIYVSNKDDKVYFLSCYPEISKNEPEIIKELDGIKLAKVRRIAVIKA